MRCTVQTIFEFHNMKWFSPIWALLFALSLILLWLLKDKWDKGYSAFFWLIIAAVIIVYCPLLADILVPRFLLSGAEYERLAWIFFEIPLLSYVLIMLAKDLKSRKLQFLFAAAFLVVLLLVGSPDNRSFFKIPRNPYKISQDTIYISDLVDSLSPDGQVVLCVQVDSENDYKSGENTAGNLYYEIREYDPRLILRHMSVQPEDYRKSDFEFPEKIPSYVDYFICPKDETISRKLTETGFEYVDESDNFSIFYNVSNQ